MKRSLLTSVIVLVFLVVLGRTVYLNYDDEPYRTSGNSAASSARFGDADNLLEIEYQADEPRVGTVSATANENIQRNASAEALSDFSKRQMDARMHAARAAFSRGDSRNEYLTQLHQQLVDSLGSDEADFRMALISEASDWDSIRNIVDQRNAALGTVGQYDQLLLDIGVATGQISLNEIKAFSARGASLPDDLVFRLASKGRIDLIEQLAENNLIANPSYEQPIQGANAIGALVSHASHYPSQYESVESVKKAIATLVEVGVVPMPMNGTSGPMDEALSNITRRNFRVKMAIIEQLLEHGVPIEQSHRDLVSSLPSGERKDELQELLANQL